MEPAVERSAGNHLEGDIGIPVEADALDPVADPDITRYVFAPIKIV